MKRVLWVAVCFCLLSLAALAADPGSSGDAKQDAAKPSASSKPIPSASPAPATDSKPVLPKTFGGWQMEGEAQASSDPALADEANAQVLKEYGFNNFENATYTRDDGRKLKVRAARFADASGAYGAFTFYKRPEMQNEKIGGQASSLNNRVLFYNGNILIDAVFDHLTAMSAAELRELAAALPMPRGGASNLPGLPAYLPKPGYVKNTAKYVVGAQALDKIGSPIPSQLVDFSAGAEVVLGNFNTGNGDGTLMLISYPTPQIATQHLKIIEAAHLASQQQQPGALPFTEVGTFLDKRSGPIIAIAAGPYSTSDAKGLLDSVHYDADITWNENTYLDKKNNIANLVWNAAILSGILIGMGLIAGLAFGGLRVLLKKMGPKGRTGEEDIEFISLGLEESTEAAVGGNRSQPVPAGGLGSNRSGG
jgi:hypothetical protein